MAACCIPRPWGPHRRPHTQRKHTFRAVPCVRKVEDEYLSQPGFNPESIRSKSTAAAGLCAWVINICKYFRLYQVVAPKRAALAEANRKLAAANDKLSGIRANIAELNGKVLSLEKDLLRATEEKNAAVAQVGVWVGVGGGREGRVLLGLDPPRILGPPIGDGQCADGGHCAEHCRPTARLQRLPSRSG